MPQEQKKDTQDNYAQKTNCLVVPDQTLGAGKLAQYDPNKQAMTLVNTKGLVSLDKQSERERNKKFIDFIFDSGSYKSKYIDYSQYESPPIDPDFLDSLFDPNYKIIEGEIVKPRLALEAPKDNLQDPQTNKTYQIIKRIASMINSDELTDIQHLSSDETLELSKFLTNLSGVMHDFRMHKDPIRQLWELDEKMGQSGALSKIQRNAYNLLQKNGVGIVFGDIGSTDNGTSGTIEVFISNEHRKNDCVAELEGRMRKEINETYLKSFTLQS